MKKLAISLAITSALGLTACDDTTLSDVQAESKDLRDTLKQEAQIPYVRVVFDPGNGVLSVPNDLLFSGTEDGTLEMPAETEAKESVPPVPVDFSNPEAALGALDGWGTQNAISIALDYDEGAAIDPATIMSGDAVAIYRVEKYPSLTDLECADPSKSGQICKGLDKLTFSVDYVTSIQNGNLIIVPLVPFDAGASYAIALTKAIKDVNGNSLLPSSSYASIEQDISQFPIIDPSIPTSELSESQAGFRTLQTLTNNFESTLVRDFGAKSENIVYTQVFTIQSAGAPSYDPLQVNKTIRGAEFGQKAMEKDPSIVTPFNKLTNLNPALPANVAEALGFEAADGLAFSLFSTADLYGAELNLPYYLDTLESGNPLTGRWEAACDSLVQVSSLSQEAIDQLSANPGAYNDYCSQFPSPLGGTFHDYQITQQDHLTKYNPIAKPKGSINGYEKVNVQVTLPNVTVANMVRQNFTLPPLPIDEGLGRPEAGWPVVILQHGITGYKEQMMAATGFLSTFGFATVAIDHPLHGERGFQKEDGSWINASDRKLDPTDPNSAPMYPGNSATHYLNLQSLLTARDNLRQSVSDGLNLRLALNAFADASKMTSPTDIANLDAEVFDTSRVYYLGHSLGAITGTNLTAIANDPIELDYRMFIEAASGDEAIARQIAQQQSGSLSALYRVNASLLVNPGSSIGNFLTESGAFGPLVKGSVIAGLGQNNSAAQALNGYMSAAFFEGNAQCTAAFNPDTDEVLEGFESLATVCAYSVFDALASEEVKAVAKAGLSQFKFAAQAVIEAGDPTNYTKLIKENGSAVLIYEMVGDGADNPSDQVIPNYVLENPFAGTTGLANLLELPQINSFKTDSSAQLSGIVRFTKGGHGTFLDPSTKLEGMYPAYFAAVNQAMQLNMAYYFSSDAHTINISEYTDIGNDIIISGCDFVKDADFNSCVSE